MRPLVGKALAPCSRHTLRATGGHNERIGHVFRSASAWHSRPSSPRGRVAVHVSSSTALNTGSYDSNDESAGVQQGLPEVARQNLESAFLLCRRFGWWSFWYQLSLTTVAAIVTLFSMAFTSQQTPHALYFTLVGVITGFLSTFWAWGYVRLSRQLRSFLDDSSRAKKVRRSDVINKLERGAIVNVVGAGASLIALQSTIGILVARTLTTAAVNPYLGAASMGATPAAIDVFGIQATTNCLLSHFGSLIIGLYLLRRIANRPSLV